MRGSAQYSEAERAAARQMALDCVTRFNNDVRTVQCDIEELVLAAFRRARVTPSVSEEQVCAPLGGDEDFFFAPVNSAVVGCALGVGNVAQPDGSVQTVDVAVLNVQVAVPAAMLQRSWVLGADGQASNPFGRLVPVVTVRLPVDRAKLSETGLAWARVVEDVAGVVHAADDVPLPRLRVEIEDAEG